MIKSETQTEYDYLDEICDNHIEHEDSLANLYSSFRRKAL